MEKKSLYEDGVFRKVVVASTGLGLACMLGSAAAVKIDAGAGLQFGWHWSILVVAALVVMWNVRFWSLVWQIQEESQEQGEGTKRKLMFHLAMLGLLGVGTFLYPIRFIEQGHYNGILRGLVTAGGFLGILVWFLYKFARGLDGMDETEAKRIKS